VTDPDTTDVSARGVRRWLDRHADRDSRTRTYLELVQAIASVLTVGGLIGLIWQIHETNETARRATYNETVDTISDLTRLDLDFPGLSCALYPGEDSGYAGLNHLNQVAVQVLILSTNAQERSWREHRDGLLDEEDWLAQDRWFQDAIVTAAMFPDIWETNRAYHPAEFVRYVDELVAHEIDRRATATVAAGGTPSVPTLADIAAADGTPTC
jgi:hypothetical protein